ncbi:PQQ-dependent sugar dehydrogenase, partial [Streptomyces sp. A475]|uniref:PQQ-dependent sugar dehydrogenase n=1 Tax=Streptomyces sp. A475 TaxID=3131976 RepID=UPI0030C9DC57
MHRKRPRFRKALALLTGSLLAGASLAIGAPHAGAAPAPDAAVAAAEDFQQVTLAKGAEEVGEPMSLAVLPDRKVLHTSRDGVLRLTDENGTTKVAGTLDVYSHDEEGLQGVGVDPK